MTEQQIADEEEAESSSFIREIAEWLVVLAGAIAIAMILRAYVITAFSIPSESMETTLLVGDHVVVSRLNYRIGDIERGDVLVFDQDPTVESGPDHLIKRVIGLGGDQVKAEDGQLLVLSADSDSWVALDESYLDPGVTTGDFGPTEVPDDHLFMMGDSRGRSLDSRSFGPVSVDRVVGQAVAVYWPPSRIGGL